MTNLAGLHDRESTALGIPDTWVLDTVALSENPVMPVYDPAYAWIARLNWGYGSTGTLPLPKDYLGFTEIAQAYVRGSKNCHRWVIGNEPNLPREWPDHQPIFPWQYAECYKLTRAAIHAIPGHERDEVLIAAAGPWNNELKYPGNPNGDWVKNFEDTIAACGMEIDGFALHAYTHGYDISLVTSSARMASPFQHRHYEFRTYRDYIETIPDGLAQLPIYLTEANGNGPWQAVGLMPAMLGELDAWNQTSKQKIYAVIFYRYPKYDDNAEFAIEGKADVIGEYCAAIGRGYQSPPVNGSITVQEQNFLPSTPNQSPSVPVPTPDLPPRHISDDFKRRVLTLNLIEPQPDKRVYRLIKAEYVPDGASRFGPDHHILVDVLDAQGKRMMGAPVNFYWGSGMKITTINKVNESYGADYSMTNHGQSYGVWVGNFPEASDDVFGMGLGTIEQPDWNHHVTYFLVFQEVVQPATQPAPVKVPPLAHPIQDPTRRVVTQVFGANDEDYAKFGLAGHAGIDFAVPMGTPIGAVDSGMVLESGNLPDYGEYVKLRHTWGESLYAHLKTRRVEAGEPINRGSIIGNSGNTGNSTGPHLHFAIRVYPYQRGYPYDGFVDPLPYLTDIATPTPSPRPKDVLTVITRAAGEFGLEWQLLASLAWAESSFDPNAKSVTGAMGLCQIMPATWAEWGVKVAAFDPYDAYDNARVSAAYLQWLLRQTPNVYAALHAYVWGIGNVLAGGVPPDEVIAYAAKVVHGRDLLKAVSA